MKKSAGVRNDLSAVETKSKARRQNTLRLVDDIDSDETVLDNPTEVRRPDMDVDVKRQRHVWKRSKRNRTREEGCIFTCVIRTRSPPIPQPSDCLITRSTDTPCLSTQPPMMTSALQPPAGTPPEAAHEPAKHRKPA